MIDPLIGTRAIHFASSILVAGAVIFSGFVAAALSGDETAASGYVRARRQVSYLTLAAMIFAVLSGGFWLVLIASQLGQTSLAEAITSGTAWSVLTETQFGRASLLRLFLVLVLAAVGLWQIRRSPKITGLAEFGALVGVAFIAALAWCGHAGGGIGFRGDLQLSSDVIHLITASMWVGGLVPLLLFIRPGLQFSAGERLRLVQRFSSMATLAVGLLAASGVLNTWFMTSGFHGIFSTEYGQLVLVKVALLTIMLGFAATNRFWLTPRLSAPDSAGALRLLSVSTTFEIGLGLVIVCVVGVLGQLEPAGHMHHEMAADAKAGPISVENAWARATPAGAEVGVGYLTIKNDGDAPDRLVLVTTTIAGQTEIHQMSMDNGEMKTRQLSWHHLEELSGRTFSLSDIDPHFRGLVSMASPVNIHNACRDQVILSY